MDPDELLFLADTAFPSDPSWSFGYDAAGGS